MTASTGVRSDAAWAPRALALQLKSMDTGGAFSASPALCGERFATLAYGCAQLPPALQNSAVIYEQARSVMVGLAAQAVPTEPTARRAYYSAVVNYAWIMTWASGILGADLLSDPLFVPNPPNARQTRPGKALGVLNTHGDVPTVLPDYAAGVGGLWGPSLTERPDGTTPTTTDVGVYETFWASDAAERRADTVSGGVHHVNYISSGRVFCERAHALALKLAMLDFVTLQVQAFAAYQTYIQTFPMSSRDAQAVAAAGAALARTKSGFTDATTGLTTAAGVAASIPVVGQVAGVILGVLTAILSILPAAVGAVRCPRGFSFRVPSSADCAPPPPPAPTTPPASNTPLIVAAGLGLGLLGLLWWKRM